MNRHHLVSCGKAKIVCYEHDVVGLVSACTTITYLLRHVLLRVVVRSFGYGIGGVLVSFRNDS